MSWANSRPGSDDSEDDKKQSSGAPDSSSTNGVSSRASQLSLAEAVSSDSSGSAKPKRSLTEMAEDNLNYSLGGFLTVAKQQKLRGVNRFFNQTIGEDIALNAQLACHHVLTGQPEELLKLLVKDPDIFFHKYPEVTFKAAGQVFYDVSPCDLIYFLCDDDMWNKVKAFAVDLPEEKRTPFLEKWQQQQTAIGKGGADLLYVTSNTPPQYASCFAIQENFDVWGGNTSIIIGLKNPDGVVCWKSLDNQVHLYYANPKTKTLEPIKRRDLSNTQQATYDAFNRRILDTMIYMRPEGSARAERSSDEVHRLFQDIFLNSTTNEPIKLTREGIHYKEDGVDYIDTHYDANRVDNAYLKGIHLYLTADAEQNLERRRALYDEVHRVWRTECANALKKRIWVVQRYCEENRPFYPLPNFNEPPFRRSLMIYNRKTDQNELLFDTKTEQFLSGFGQDDVRVGFSIYKGAEAGATGACGREVAQRGTWRWRSDLIAENRLTVDATNTIEIPIKLPTPSTGIAPGF